jgi:hypothetical protein
MASPLSIPGRPPSARPSKVDRSRRILAGSAAAASSGLLLWLILAAMMDRHAGGGAGLALLIDTPDSVVDVLPTSAADTILVSEAVGLSGGGASIDPRELIRRLENLPGGGSSPRVFFLSAVGISSTDSEGGTEPYFLPPGGDPSDPGTMVPARQVIASLTDPERGRGPTLLILDASQVDSDRGTGVFANSFLRHLDDLIQDDSNLLVLTSCAPGQVSWTADPYGRSIFADCVARSGAWGRGSVADLHEQVASRVSSWARTHRNAIQTPQLLGNLRRNDFGLPPLQSPPEDKAVPPEVPEELRGRLRASWEAQLEIARSRPYLGYPLRWRQYRDGLLRAERLIRSGRVAEAGPALDRVDSLAEDLRKQLDAAPPARLPSFAMRIAMAPPGRRAEIEQEWEAAEETIRRFFRGEPAAAASSPAPPSSTAVASAEPAPDAPDTGDSPTTPADTAKALPVEPAGPNSISELPPSAEGLLAERYALFLSLGGEDEDLRPVRQDRLMQGFDLAIKAEQVAAVDGRLLPWIAPVVAEADRRRLEGQDLLFASDLEAIRSARDLLVDASGRYDEALALARPLTEAIELLQLLADELPYDGEWAAPEPSRHSQIDLLLTRAATLADLIASPPPGWNASVITRGGTSASLQQINGQLRTVRGEYNTLTRTFATLVDRSARPGASSSWRRLDAMLRVPTIPVDSRMALVDASLAVDRPLLPAREDYGSPDGTPGPDEGFWNRATGLARFELGLLRLSGIPVDDLRGDLGRAESWENSQDRAFDAMDAISRGIRRHRDDLLDRRPPGDDDGRSPGRDLRAADWLARTLPAATLQRRFDPDDSPSGLRSGRDRAEQLAWQARRLADDLALALAGDALALARTLDSGAPNLAEVGAAIDPLRSAALRVENQDPGDAPGRAAVALAVSGGEQMPPGKAVLLLKHDPVKVLRARPGDSMIGVPVSGRTDHRIEIDFAEGTDATPTVFYRGQQFEGRPVTISEVEQVSLAVRQRFQFAVDKNGEEITYRNRRIEVADQFLEHPDEGYLHPNSRLDYRLELTNRTPDPVSVVVAQRWEEGPARETQVDLAPGESLPDSVIGSVSSIDFTPEQPVRVLTVEVRESGGMGRPLCKPRRVEFRVLDPKQYIAARPYYKGGINPEVGLFVQHLDVDRTTVPTITAVTPEPFTAVRQIDAPEWISRGAYGTYRYRITDPNIEKLKFSIEVDGVPEAIVKEYTIQEIKKEPVSPPEADPKVPKL